MLTFTSAQQDALIEIGNIGMSKAAKQLSVLLNLPVQISIPKMSILSLETIKNDNTLDHKQIYSFVYQMLTADLQGCAALVFRREHANLLMMSVSGKSLEFTQEEVRACEQEAMLEIGNIIITSCISVIANMLSQNVRLSLSAYDEDYILDLLGNLCTPFAKSSKNIIVITTTLNTLNDVFSGYLFIMLTEESANILVKRIEELIRG